ncbi:MAG: peptidyl-prolyl cis-trans isomerase [Reichenbachiella sp.]
MIRNLAVTLLLLTYFIPLSAQDEPKYASKVLFQLGDQSYNLGEFEYYFLKNSERPSADSAKIAVDEYLELYVNFRLKVEEAKHQGLDTLTAFVQEFEGYKKQLVEPFLTSTKFEENLVKEAYDRSLYEVSASHLLLKMEKNALPEDTFRIYNETMAIKERIAAGESFEALAKEKSQDPSAKTNGGQLGYFSALQMVYPFENAAFDNEVGDVVGPVRTRFGYHLLKINDKREARGEVLTAHIMLRQGQDSASIELAKEKADKVYNELQGGADWNKLCATYSEDVNTSKTGGELKWFATGALVPEFEDAAFALDAIGSITAPVQTRFGWHIIKLIDKKGPPSYEEAKVDLESRVKRDDRSRAQKSDVIASIKKSQNFQLDSATWELAIDQIDSAILEGKWSPSDTLITGTKLIDMNDADFTIANFYQYLTDNQKVRRKTDLSEYILQLYNRFEQQCIFDAEEIYVENNNRDYRMLLDEYKSGILLFNLMEDEVWGKALSDTVGLQAYFEMKKESYQKPEVAKGKKVSCKDSTELNTAIALMSGDSTMRVDDDELFGIEQGEISFLDSNWTEGVYTESDADGYTVWNIEEIVKPEPVELNDMKGQVISDYQKKLEDDWVIELRTKYPLKVSKKVLKYYVKTFK